MTHDYKSALDALNKWNCIDRRLNHKAREFGRKQAELFLECNLENLRHALHLAQEAEQLRKERDDYKDLYDVMVERYTELAKKVRNENGNA